MKFAKRRLSICIVFLGLAFSSCFAFNNKDNVIKKIKEAITSKNEDQLSLALKENGKKKYTKKRTYASQALLLIVSQSKILEPDYALMDIALKNGANPNLKSIIRKVVALENKAFSGVFDLFLKYKLNPKKIIGRSISKKKVKNLETILKKVGKEAYEEGIIFSDKALKLVVDQVYFDWRKKIKLDSDYKLMKIALENGANPDRLISTIFALKEEAFSGTLDLFLKYK
ncbi:hypothetical protein ACFLYU_05340, partial [Candidatus Dependentiae bacterium]